MAATPTSGKLKRKYHEDTNKDRKMSRLDKEWIVAKQSQVDVEKYFNAREKEILEFSESVKRIGGTKLVSQRLPRHMRRRAMSHSVKRLPIRLREVSAAEIEKSKSTKRPSRKFRRRPANLSSDYERRKRSIGWLETHIWHAKRFIMMEKWGYRLPYHPTDKCMRVCHRAADKYCLLQDVSFECCIEISGQYKKIKSVLKRFISRNTESALLDTKYMNGNIWGKTLMFEDDQYPEKLIGEVSFLWRPAIADSLDRTLWIWTHPSCSLLVFDKIVEMLTRPGGITMTTNATDTSIKAPDQNKVQEYIGKRVKVKYRKDVFNKFRLTGANSTSIISEIMQLSEVDSPDNGTLWWQRYYSRKDNIKTFQEQVTISDWLKRCNFSDIPTNQVLSLIVRDPRLLLPPKKSKVISEKKEKSTFPTFEGKYCYVDSPLWDASICDEIKSTKISDYQLNLKRSEQLVPGLPLELDEAESRIPVLLLQRPGLMSASHPDGFGSGWDVILPPAWGMSFLVAFVFRGARIGGLREATAVNREAISLEFPADFPDCPAGVDSAEVDRKLLQEKYDRNPPAKRPNYVKLGIQHPFICPWSRLVDEWKISANIKNDRAFFVVCDVKVKVFLQQCLSLNVKEDIVSQLEKMGFMADFYSNGLIPLGITMEGKGVPSKYSHICIPQESDLQHCEDDSSLPVEPKHIDIQSKIRRLEKKRNKKNKSLSLAQLSNPMEEALRRALTESDAIQKDSKQLSITTSTIRTVIGFVNDGGFLLSQGRGVGKGFCTILGLLELLNRIPAGKQCQVLIRNTNSLQYRSGVISVII